MTKKGSALMQVMVVGLIISAFSVLMLRYAVTRSANLTRTERILESRVVADSCLDQYMAYYAEMELSGREICNFDLFSCKAYASDGEPYLIPLTLTRTVPYSDLMVAIRYSVAAQ